jgi:hypothetical protein
MGKKVLILGESHYHNCEIDDDCNKLNKKQREKQHRELTKKVVEWWKDKPAKTPVSSAVPKLFEIGRYDFWNRVSFYNYVQSFVFAPGNRPADEDWDISTKAFQQVLDCLQPDRVLVLGKKNWLSLPNDPAVLACNPIPEPRLKLLDKVAGLNIDDGFAYWYGCHSGHLALAMPVIHPAYRRGFRAEEWVPYVRKWLILDDFR